MEKFIRIIDEDTHINDIRSEFKGIELLSKREISNVFENIFNGWDYTVYSKIKPENVPESNFMCVKYPDTVYEFRNNGERFLCRGR